MCFKAGVTNVTNRVTRMGRGGYEVTGVAKATRQKEFQAYATEPFEEPESRDGMDHPPSQSDPPGITKDHSVIQSDPTRKIARDTKYISNSYFYQHED